MTNNFSFRRVGTSGCEILCGDHVVAWAVDELWAAMIVNSLRDNDDFPFGL